MNEDRQTMLDKISGALETLSKRLEQAVIRRETMKTEDPGELYRLHWEASQRQETEPGPDVTGVEDSDELYKIYANHQWKGDQND